MSLDPRCLKGEDGHRTDPSLLGLEEGISCSCGCVMHCIGGFVDTSW